MKRILLFSIFVALTAFSYAQNKEYAEKAGIQLKEISAYYENTDYPLDSLQKAKIYSINYGIQDKIDSFLNDNNLSREEFEAGVKERKELRIKLIKDVLSPQQREKFIGFQQNNKSDE